MNLPLAIHARLLNPGASNASLPHCLGLTFFHGQLIMAYGSSDKVIVATSTLSIICSLDNHDHGCTVTAVSWAPYSGRLTSAATDGKIIIYEPESNQNGSFSWSFLKEVKIYDDSIITCLSWSLWDYTFCTCSDYFTIYHTNSNQYMPGSKLLLDGFKVSKVARYQIKTIFCSHSRDSRFILTIPYQSKDVILYHRREKTTTEYCQIHLSHPSIVKSARWRTSDQIHERNFFLTIAEDHILRIWSETCVSEQCYFSVVATIPGNYHVTAANFVSTASRLISNNPLVLKTKNDANDNSLNNMSGNENKVRSDVYVNGHGHDRVCDRNTRETNVATQKELESNHFYILTVNEYQKIIIWEVSGISPNVRTTPTIVKFTHSVPLGISSSSVNQIYAYCRLESEFHHLTEPNFIGKPSSMFMVIQNNETKVITSLDASITKRTSSSSLSEINREYLMNIHGHESEIRRIRVHPETTYMASLDRNDNVILWKYNDTDVYDSSHLITFHCQLAKKFKEIAWFPKKNLLLGSSGKKFHIIKIPDKPNTKANVNVTTLSYALPPSNSYIVDGRNVMPLEEEKEENKREKSIENKTDPRDDLEAFNLLALNIALQLPDQSYIAYAASSTIVIAMRINLSTDKADCIKRITTKPSSDGKDNNFVDCASVYISRILPMPGASICFFATKHAVFCTVLTKSQITPENISECVNVEKCIEIEDDEIISLCVCHPAYLFIACANTIYVCFRVSPTYHQFVIIQTIQTGSCVPLKLRCIPSGILSVMSKDGIHLYHPKRFSKSYLSSNLTWVEVASCNSKESFQQSDLEWTLDGILVYSTGRQIKALTKYMDTYKLKTTTEYKLPTVHQNLSHLSEMIPDVHPSVLIPITISGRKNLALNLLNFLNENYDDPDSHYCYPNLILHQSGSKKEDSPFEGDVDELLSSLTDKLTNNPLPDLNEDDNKSLLEFVKKFKDVISITTDSIDKIALPVARALTLNQENMIPFDLVQLAYMSQEQQKLLDLIDFNNWESIENSGVFYWINDIPSLADRLTKFAISCFRDQQCLSLAILVGLQKFLILKSLFIKGGENAKGAFFSRDFTKQKNKNSAEKNAYSALKKHDYHNAAALFFLADKLSIAIHIIMEDIKDPALAYFFARCYDIKNESILPTSESNQHTETESNQTVSFSTYLVNVAIPHAIKQKDFAAVDYFKRKIDPTLSYDVTQRYQSAVAGNVVESAKYWGDMRFVTSELLRTTIDQKAYLSLCFLLTGHYLLSALFINYFDVRFDSKKMLNSSSIGDLKSGNLDKPSLNSLLSKRVEVKNEDESSDADDDDDESTKNSNASFSFGWNGFKDLGNDVYYSSDSDNEDEESSNQSSFKRPLISNSPAVFNYKFKYNNNNNNNNNNALQQSPSFLSPSQFNTSFIARDFSVNFQSKKSVFRTSEIKERDFEADCLNWFIIVVGFNIARNRLESFLEKKRDFKVIDYTVDQIISEIQTTEKQLNLRNHQLLDYLIRSCKRNGFVFRRLLLISGDEDKMDYVIKICINLAKIPAQMVSSSISSQQVAQIAMALKCLISFMNQVKPFEKTDQDDLEPYYYIYTSVISSLYIMAVFYHNADLMKKVLNFNFPDLKPFQDAIKIDSAPPSKDLYTKYLATSIDSNYFSFMKPSILQDFIHVAPKSNPRIFETFVSALLDAIFIDSFYRRLTDFRDQIFAKTELRYPQFIQEIVMSIKKLRDTQAKFFSYVTLKMKHFYNFNLLDDIRSDKESEKDLNELIEQQLEEYGRKRLIRLFCKSMISKFNFSIKDLERKKNMRAGFILKHIHINNEDVKSDVYDVCFTMNGRLLVIITKDGCTQIDMDTIDQDQEETSYSTIAAAATATSASSSSTIASQNKLEDKIKGSNSLFFEEKNNQENENTKINEKDSSSSDDDNDNNENDKIKNIKNNNEYESDNDDVDDKLSESENDESDSYSLSDQYSEISHSVSTSSSTKSSTSSSTIKTFQPTQSHFQCIKKHPIKSMVLVGFDGGVSILSFDSELEKEKFNFTSNSAASCTGVAFSSDGTMFAAARERQVDLYSFFVKDDKYKIKSKNSTSNAATTTTTTASNNKEANNELQIMRKTPFTIIQTFSSQVLGVEFIKGTGLIVTIQAHSHQCPASIAFWDVFMQNSMVASISLNKKDGLVTTMAYSSNYSRLFVGTAKGIVFTIDTKTFQIINRWKIYSLHSHKSKDKKKDKEKKEKKEKEKEKDKDKKEKKEKKHKEKKEKKLTKKEKKERICGVSAMFIDEEQTFLATGSTNGNLKIWDILTSKKLLKEHIFDKPKLEITSIDCSKNNVFCIAGGHQIKLYLYTLQHSIHHKHKHDKK